jgi:hypothetical protein
MFEKIGRLAETAVNNMSLSRRGFLDRLGQGALAALGVLGGAFLFGRGARAGGGVYCCKYECPSPYHPRPSYRCYSGICPFSVGVRCYLKSYKLVRSCTGCR